MDTRNKLRHLFRRRCRHYMGRGDLVYSYANPDRIDEWGTIVEGFRFEVFGSVSCCRWRWHRGEHRPAALESCVPVECPPVEPFEINGVWKEKGL